MQERNSNPDILLFIANSDNFLSTTIEPDTIVVSLSLDMWEKFFPNFIIVPLKPPSLIKIFEPAPITLNGKI